MLDYAKNHEKRLMFEIIWNKDLAENKYLFVGNGEFKLFKDENIAHEFVSLDNDYNVIGLIRYGVSNNEAYNLEIIDFDNQKQNIFSIDLLVACKDIFELYNLDVFKFSAKKQHPMIEKYKKLTNHYGGSFIEGKNDYLLFEIKRENYFNL